MQVIQHINANDRQFIISQTDKGYFAHELGELTQWAIVTGNGERKAHRINPARRFANQYGAFWRPIPFKSLQDAANAVNDYSKKVVIRA